MRVPLGIAVPALLFAVYGELWAQAPAWHSGVAKVSVKSELDRKPGTGFVVALRGGNAYLITSAHVVEGDASPQIEFVVDSDRTYRATVRGLEAGEERGLALLVVGGPPAGAAAITVSGDGPPARQSKVDVAGFPVPFSTFSVVDTTVASRRGRDIMLSRETGEGFSGGPVLLNGAVVGVIFGREPGFGKMVGAVSIRDYLAGHQISVDASAVVVEPPKPPSGPRPGEERTNPLDGLTYVRIPPDTFTMGCSPDDKECDTGEKPAHPVTISKGFWLGKSEVTQAAYEKVTGTNPSNFRSANRPVEQVSWTEADAYCKKAGRRLPTEAEWEYAARSGSTAARDGDLDQVAWYSGNSQATTHDVMTKGKNAFGLHDMLGNVWEWVADWSGPYSAAAATDPRGALSSDGKVVRGGSWYIHPQLVRASTRYGYGVSYRNYNFGFRCAGEFR